MGYSSIPFSSALVRRTLQTGSAAVYEQQSTRKGVVIMGISIRCATVASLIALGLLSESQTFALAFCNGGSAAVLRSSARAGNIMMPSSWSGRHRSMRTARVGRHRKVALMMSEMEEDYPSDTGDDRFSAGGKLGGIGKAGEAQKADMCACLLAEQMQLLFRCSCSKHFPGSGPWWHSILQLTSSAVEYCCCD